MKYFITGGAGFIGSHLAKELLKEGKVTVYDNLSLGRRALIRDLEKNEKFRFIRGDLKNLKKLKRAIAGHDVVFHLAANSDISKGAKYTDIDLKNGTIATYNVLEAMRINDIKKIVFSSSSAIYGEAKKMPTSEDYGPLFPISLYGASKLASEALISAFCHNYDMQAWIFRFANIVGSHGTHGVIIDFIRKLRRNPKELEVLGNGKQAKPYLHVSDCVFGIIYGFKHSNEQLNFFNLGCRGNTSVKKIAENVIKRMGLKKVKIIYTGGKRGWKGDVPIVSYNVSKIEQIGWKARHSSDDAVKIAIKELIEEK